MPHITEELWHNLGYLGEGQKFIQETTIPTAESLVASLTKVGIKLDENAAAVARDLNETIAKMRAMKADHNLGTKRDVKFCYVADDAKAGIVEEDKDTLMRLAGAGKMDRVTAQPEGSPAGVTPLGTVYLDLASSVDAVAEKARLGKELEKLAKAIASAEARLANEKFVGSAPASVVQGAKDQLAQNVAKKEEIERLIAALGK